MAGNLLRAIPSVNDLLENPALKSLTARLSHNVVVAGVRTILDELRAEVRTVADEHNLPSVGDLAERIARRLAERDVPSLRPVINATGVLLHTGLGRAPLAEAAVEAMVAAARNYASVELDLTTGKRSHRGQATAALLVAATGAEAALVVNNNAGATLLALAAVCGGREAIVSRGELIEIGGSYRLPDVMAASGCTLREVGTTNKTRLDDYVAAIGAATGAILVVHPSNFVVAGFAEKPSLAELVALARERGVPLIHDIGSGALVDFERYGLSQEPVASASVRSGADLVLFSGDKLLGGPQCGIAVGRRSLVELLDRHPLARALRVDKLTLAALAATLRLYRQVEDAEREIPLLQFLTTGKENLELRAKRLAPQLSACSALGGAEAVPDVTYLGGGAVPTQELATWCVALSPRAASVDRLAAALRGGTPAVVGRVRQDRLLLDLRSVFPRQDAELVRAVAALGTGELA